jgi:penicillin-binding protein-related factor A (putative recombinase)
MARTERTFCTELKRSTPTIQPCFWWKIPDAGFRNYFDIVCCAKRQFIAIEAKISKSKTSIPLMELFKNREHELLALKKVRESGGQAWILINIFNPHKWNYVLAMDIAQYLLLVEYAKPKKSIKLNDPMITNEILHIYKNDERLWDLTKLIK